MAVVNNLEFQANDFVTTNLLIQSPSRDAQGCSWARSPSPKTE